MSARTSEIVIGDDIAVPVTLKKNGATFSIDSGATILAALIDTDHNVKLTPNVTVLEATGGSDWANSLIVVVMSSTITGVLKPVRNAKMEIQVDDSGKQTWFAEGIKIKKGLID